MGQNSGNPRQLGLTPARALSISNLPCPHGKTANEADRCSLTALSTMRMLATEIPVSTRRIFSDAGLGPAKATMNAKWARAPTESTEFLGELDATRRRQERACQE